MESLSGESVASPFWQFSLAFYRQPGVADACIRLQEEAGVDVNLLLFLLWQASLKRGLFLPARCKHSSGASLHGARKSSYPCAPCGARSSHLPRSFPLPPPSCFAPGSKQSSSKPSGFRNKPCTSLHALRRWGARYRRKKKPRGSMLQAMPRSRGRAFKLLPSKHCSRRSIYDHLNI